MVYAAVDEKLNRPVAVKTIRDAGADTPTRERFWREARAAAAVSHPNICQLCDIAEDGDQLFLVMELLEGQPLSEKLRARCHRMMRSRCCYRCSRRSRRCTRAASCIGT